jgi:hypothetical protein
VGRLTWPVSAGRRHNEKVGKPIGFRPFKKGRVVKSATAPKPGCYNIQIKLLVLAGTRPRQGQVGPSRNFGMSALAPTRSLVRASGARASPGKPGLRPQLAPRCQRAAAQGRNPGSSRLAFMELACAPERRVPVWRPTPHCDRDSRVAQEQQPTAHVRVERRQQQVPRAIQRRGQRHGHVIVGAEPARN